MSVQSSMSKEASQFMENAFRHVNDHNTRLCNSVNNFVGSNQKERVFLFLFIF